MPSTITTPDLIKRFLGLSEADAQAPMIRIYNSGAGSATAATVQVTGVSVVLVVTGGSNAGTSTVTFAAAVTIAGLVSAINALNKGWVAAVDGEGSESATSMILMQATSAYLQTAMLTLYATANYVFQKLADGVNGQIEAICGRIFANTAYVERYNGNSKSRLYLNNAPVEYVQRLSIGTVAAIRVKNSGVGATFASVGVYRDPPGDPSYTLKILFAATDSAGASTASGVTLSTSPRLTDVVTTINAVGSGWSAVLADSSLANYSSALLASVGSRGCLDNYADLSIPATPESGYEVNSEGGYIDLLGGQPTVLDDSAFCGGAYWGQRVLVSGPVFPSGVNNIYVEYTAGYVTMPPALVMIATRIAAEIYTSLKFAPGLSQGKSADVSWVRNEAGIAVQSAANITQLRPFMKQVI